MAKRAETVVEVKPQVSTGRWVGVCIAAWLAPGLGHFLLGRKIRGVILFAAIVAMFLLGLAMQGQIFEVESTRWLRSLGYVGELCVGLPLLVARWWGYAGGNPFFQSSDYGTAFLVTAGMLNVLCIFDAYDIALGRKP